MIFVCQSEWGGAHRSTERDTTLTLAPWDLQIPPKNLASSFHHIPQEISGPTVTLQMSVENSFSTKMSLHRCYPTEQPISTGMAMFQRYRSFIWKVKVDNKWKNVSSELFTFLQFYFYTHPHRPVASQSQLSDRLECMFHWITETWNPSCMECFTRINFGLIWGLNLHGFSWQTHQLAIMGLDNLHNQ